MILQSTRAERFKSLHRPGHPLILFNVWDVGSAQAVAEAGAPAIATGSWAVAKANGFEDGERLPLDLAIGNLARIVSSVDLAVTFDLERGYSEDASGVAHSVAAAIEAGAVGCNIEDSLPGSGAPRGIADAAQRIAAARGAAASSNLDIYLNARTDVFFQKPSDQHDAAMVDQALVRARAYADAGASGIFVPGLIDEALIERLVGASPLPVNIMVMPGTPVRERLAELGVARISHGAGPYLGAMKWLTTAAIAAMS